MKQSTYHLLSRYSDIKKKLSSMQDDSFYPFIVYPNLFSFLSDNTINPDSLFSYCVQTKGDNQCMQQLKEPRRPTEPYMHDIPLTHIEYVRESFWQSFNGHIFKIWLITAILLGGLPGYGICEGPTYEKLLCALLFMFLYTPILIIQLVRNGKKREYISKRIPYTKEEINDLTSQEQKRFEKAMAEYPNLVHKYEEDLEQYNELMKQREIIMYRSVSSFLSWRLKRSFTKSEDYSVVDEAPKKGRSEDRLFSSLMNRIPSSVHIDTVISGYYPDIMIATSNNVYIDIEIDEPYEMESKKEIHYIGGEDEMRNTRIANRDWIILRFSEKQIITDCSSCTKLIEELKKIVEKGDLEAIDTIISIKDTIKDRRWRKEDARMMAIKNYRKSY